MDTSAPSISSKVCCMSWCFQSGQDLSVSKWSGSGMWENGTPRPSRTLTIQNDIQMIHTLDYTRYTGLIPPLDVYLSASSGWAGCASMLGPVELKDSISHFDQGVRILLGDWDCYGVYKKAVSRKKTLKSWTCEAPVRNYESLKMKDICKIDWKIYIYIEIYWNIGGYTWRKIANI